MNGILGKMMTNALAAVSPYQVPANVDFTTVNIQMVNSDPIKSATVKVAICTTTAPAVMDYIETGAIIPANGGRLLMTCELMGPGERIVVESTSNNVAVRVTGLEKLL